MLACAVLLLATSGCGYSELEQEVVDLRNEAYSLIEIEPTGDHFSLNTRTDHERCDLSVSLKDIERGADLSKVEELATGVYPKMEPAALYYERHGWGVVREFHQYVPRELPTFWFQAVKDFRRVRILVNGGAIEVSAWADPGCTGRDGFLTPIDDRVDEFPKLENLLAE